MVLRTVPECSTSLTTEYTEVTLPHPPPVAATRSRTMVWYAGGCSVVCYGEGCNATFTDVTFADCTLVVLAGAHVTLNAPTFTQEGEVGASLSVLADGAGTKVVVNSGDITGGMQGAIVQGGAHLEACDLTIAEVELTGVLVKDEGSSLSLTSCTMQDFSSLHNDVSDGVWLHSNATASLSKCNFAHAGRACIFVSHSGTGHLHDCAMLESGSGIHATGSCSHVHATRCHFVHNTGPGALVLGGATLTGDMCRSEGNARAGYAVSESGSEMQLIDCTSDSDDVGCSASYQGTLIARKVNVSGSWEQGYWCQGGTMDLKVCSATACIENGVLCGCVVVDGCMSVLHAVGCTMQVNGHAGFVSEQGAEMSLKGCCSRKNTGVGLLVKESGSMEVSMSCIDDNERGFHVTDTGVLNAEEVKVARSMFDGVLVDLNGVATVKECSVTDNGRFGVLVEGEGARINASDSVITGNSATDAVALSFGVLDVTDCVGIESTNAFEVALV